MFHRTRQAPARGFRDPAGSRSQRAEARPGRSLRFLAPHRSNLADERLAQVRIRLAAGRATEVQLVQSGEFVEQAPVPTDVTVVVRVDDDRDDEAAADDLLRPLERLPPLAKDVRLPPAPGAPGDHGHEEAGGPAGLRTGRSCPSVARGERGAIEPPIPRHGPPPARPPY